MGATDAKIVSYISLSFGFLFYLIAGYIRGFGTNKHDMDTYTRDTYSRILIVLSAISISIATFSGAGGKQIDTKAILNIVITMLALVLVLLGAWRQWGLLAITLATTIAIFSSVQFVLVN